MTKLEKENKELKTIRNEPQEQLSRFTEVESISET